MTDVYVLGSINMDVVLRVDALPRPGETVLAAAMSRSAGGKGANQGVAAARAGARAALAGAVGDDEDGRALVALLEAEAVDCADVRVEAGAATGTAHIAVDARGENMIVVAPGANGCARAPAEARARVFLSQLETPLEAVAGLFAARPPGTLTILNAAPFRPEAAALLAMADVVVVNETELAGYCNGKPPRSASEAAAMARTLRRGGVTVVTLGPLGSVTVGDGVEIITPAAEAQVQDTTGAGDCFCGYLAAGLAQGAALQDAIATAHRAAALCVARPGAIPSIPRVADLT